jgi:hypothetical protein
MAWTWIGISLKSWMGCPNGSGKKTKSYEPVSQIACISVSVFFVLNELIPTYLGTRGNQGGEALFLDLRDFFAVSADSRLDKFVHTNLFCTNSFM